MGMQYVYSPSQEADKEDERKLSIAAHDHLVAKMSSPTRNTGGGRQRNIVGETDIDRRRQAAAAQRPRGVAGA